MKDAEFSVKLRNSDRHNVIFELNKESVNEIGIYDDNPEEIKKRKQIRARIAELASRKSTNCYSKDNSFEEPLEPIVKRRSKFDPNEYYNIPFNNDIQPEIIDDNIPQSNSPIECKNNNYDESIQIKRFNNQIKPQDSYSKKSIDIKESLDYQKASSNVNDSEVLVLNKNEIKSMPVKNVKTKKVKNVKEKKSVKSLIDKNNENVNRDMENNKNIIEEECHVEDIYIVEEPVYNLDNYDNQMENIPHNNQDYDYINNIKTKKSYSTENLKIFEKSHIEEDNRVIDFDNESDNLQNKKTLKKTNLPFVDKTNVLPTKRSKNRTSKQKNFKNDMNKGNIIRI